MGAGPNTKEITFPILISHQKVDMKKHVNKFKLLFYGANRHVQAIPCSMVPQIPHYRGPISQQLYQPCSRPFNSGSLVVAVVGCVFIQATGVGAGGWDDGDDISSERRKKLKYLHNGQFFHF